MRLLFILAHAVNLPKRHSQPEHHHRPRRWITEFHSINTSEDCGCNGPIKSRLDNEPGVIEVLSIGGERNFRIVNKDREYYFIPCDTVAIAALYKIKKLDVKFSGDVMQFCDNPTVHLLPPIYYPIKLSNIQSLSPVLFH